MTGRAPRSAGLTLVELLVVMTIAGVATAVTLPALARMTRTGAADAARELVSALHTARDAATRRAAAARVSVDPVTGRYTVVVERVPGGEEDTLLRGSLRAGPAVRIMQVTGGVTTTFDQMGRARGGAIRIADNEETYDVSADPWSGAVTARRR